MMLLMNKEDKKFSSADAGNSLDQMVILEE